MKRVITIDYCDQCPYFDNSYYNYQEKCTVLNRQIYREKNTGHTIPDDCLLPIAED